MITLFIYFYFFNFHFLSYYYLILNNDNIYFKSKLAANNSFINIFKIILEYYQKINLAG